MMTTRTTPLSAAPRLVDVLTVALLFGAVAGVLEPLLRVSGISTGGAADDSLGAYLWWMPTAAYFLCFTILGCIGWVIARGMPRVVTLQRLTIGLAALAFMASLRILEGQLGSLAVNLISIGLAVQLVNWIGPRLLHSLPQARIAVGLALIAVVTLATGIEVRRAWRERQILGTLPAARPGAPNILFLVLDTVRAMSLSAYGYARPTTPTLEQLAARGTLFEHALSAAPWTRPAHAGFFTGQWEHHQTADWLMPLDNRHLTLAEALAKQGYRTGGFTANLGQTSRSTGIARGFAHYEDYTVSLLQVLMSATSSRKAYNELQRRLPLPEVRWGFPRKSSAGVNRALLAWLDRSGKAPFFAFANYMDAHAPYRPRVPFDTAFSSPAYPPPRSTRTGDTRSVRDMRRYDQAIATIDHDLAELLEALDRRGLLDNTIIVVTADHGEAFGEHGIYQHGFTLYTPMLHVPLVISWPGKIPAGHRVSPWVSTRSLPATLMHLVDAETRQPFPGVLLSGFWESENAEPETLFAGSRYAPNNPVWYPTSKGNIQGILHHGTMLIREADDHRELYELHDDPWMTTDRYENPGADSIRTLLGTMLEQEVGPPVLHPDFRDRSADAAGH